MESIALQILAEDTVDKIQEVRQLKREIAERDALLRKILDEVNTDYAHGGPSRLSEEIIRDIEKILGV